MKNYFENVSRSTGLTYLRRLLTKEKYLWTLKWKILGNHFGKSKPLRYTMRIMISETSRN